MRNKLMALPMVLFLSACCSTKTEYKTVEVKIPVPMVVKIDLLPPFEGQCDKIKVSERRDYKKIAQACRQDLEVLKKRNELYEEKIKHNNGE